MGMTRAIIFVGVTAFGLALVGAACSGGDQDRVPEAPDDDGDGMPNEWEDRWDVVDGSVADADGDPDGDGFSNLDEYLGGSSPADPASLPVPFRVVRILTETTDVMFRGYIVKAGGDVDVVDPKYWVVKITWGKDSQTEIAELGDSLHGWKVESVVKRKVRRESRHGIPAYDEDVYFLTLTKAGFEPVVLERGRWTKITESRADLSVTRGKDAGKMLRKLEAGESVEANSARYRVERIRPGEVVLKTEEGKTYTLHAQRESRKAAEKPD